MPKQPEESNVVLKRRSFSAAEEIPQPPQVTFIGKDGEPLPYPWTSAACAFLRFVAFGWIISAVFGVFVAVDMVSRAPNMVLGIQVSFAWAMVIFTSLTVGVCMMAISELSILIAKHVTSPKT